MADLQTFKMSKKWEYRIVDWIMPWYHLKITKPDHMPPYDPFIEVSFLPHGNPSLCLSEGGGLKKKTKQLRKQKPEI